MLDWPGFLFPLWLALLSPPKPDTLRTEVKKISFEKKTEYEMITCTIVNKQPSVYLDDDGVYYTYETECGDILNIKETYVVGDTLSRKKIKGTHK